MNGNFLVGPWLVEPSLNTISRNGTAVHIEPKVMEVLVCLAKHASESVPKEMLIQAVWPDTFVTDDVLKRAISELRRVFEDDAREPHIIQTIPKRGYRLVAPVEPVDASGATPVRVPQTPVGARATGTVQRVWWISALVFTAFAALGVVHYWPNREAPIDSIAVMPFANDNADSNGELLGDGITSGLIESLSQIPYLKVMSRSAVFHYKGREIDPRTVGRELNVRALLTGRIVQRGDGFVLDAELVNTSDGSHLWGQQYNGKASNVLTLQAELASAVSTKLRPRLATEAKVKLVNPGTSNPEAYALYVKGRYSFDLWKPEPAKAALTFFQQAVEKDPTYAQAYAGVGDAYALLTFYAFIPFEEGFLKARAAAQKALELDVNLAEGHCALGLAAYTHYEWTLAESQTRKCVELNPNLSYAHQWHAWAVASVGKMEQSVAEEKLALEVDPLSHMSNNFLAIAYYNSRDYEHAIEQMRKVLEVEPNDPDLHDRMGNYQAKKGEYDEAAQEYEKALLLRGEDEQSEKLRRAYAKDGFPGLLKAQIELWSNPKKPDDYDPYDVAANYSMLGDPDNAFLWLDRALEAKFTLSSSLLSVKIDPFLDNIRSDPRYKTFLRRMGFPQ